MFALFLLLRPPRNRLLAQTTRGVAERSMEGKADVDAHTPLLRHELRLSRRPFVRTSGAERPGQGGAARGLCGRATLPAAGLSFPALGRCSRVPGA